jgi:hypothetical protein
MALIGFNSLNGLDSLQWLNTFDTFHNGGGNATIIAGRYSGTAVQLAGTGFDYTHGSYTLSNQRTVIQGVDIGGNFAGGGYGDVFILMDSTTPQISIRVETTGHVSAYQGPSLTSAAGTLLGTSTNAVITGAWQHLESKIFIDASAGTVIVKVDNFIVLSLTAVNTQTSSNNYATSAMLHHAELGASVVNLANYYVLDTTGAAPYDDFIGPQNVTTHDPISNGSNINFTPLNAPNFSQVNEVAIIGNTNFANPIPDGDASYNFSINSASDIVETFNLTGFNALSSNNAIQVIVWAKSTVASGTRQIKATLYKGSTAYKGSTFNVTDNTQYIPFVDKTSFLLVDPASSTPWTAALANTYQFGYTNVGNGIMDGTDVRITKIKVERMGPVQDPFAPNHPLWITG